MDKIIIRNLVINTIIGIHEEERIKPQPVCLNLDMSSDVRRAAAAEQIEAALDYQAVSERLEQFVSNSHFQLVETLAEQIAELVRREFDVEWIRLEVQKPDALPGETSVGVIIERGHMPERA